FRTTFQFRPRIPLEEAVQVRGIVGGTGPPPSGGSPGLSTHVGRASVNNGSKRKSSIFFVKCSISSCQKVSKSEQSLRRKEVMPNPAHSREAPVNYRIEIWRLKWPPAIVPWGKSHGRKRNKKTVPRSRFGLVCAREHVAITLAQARARAT